MLPTPLVVSRATECSLTCCQSSSPPRTSTRAPVVLTRIFSLAARGGWPGVAAIPQGDLHWATGHRRGRDMAVFLAAHICPICGADAIDRVPRDGAVDYFVSLCWWRVYECCECRCRFYDWPSDARHYRNSVTGTTKYFALCMKVLSFELWRWGSRLVDRS